MLVSSIHGIAIVSILFVILRHEGPRIRKI